MTHEQRETNVVIDIYSHSSNEMTRRNDDLSTLYEIANQIDELANDDINEEDEENARLGGQYFIDKLPTGLMNEILRKGDRIVSLAGQLVTNKTRKLAETYMSINAKFNGRKQVNRIQRG